jgi:D-lyxose ketol-isomerase
MKRSEIERAVAQAAGAFKAAGFRLPPFADWSAQTWRERLDSHAARSGCGWDVTDYGLGDFARKGLTLFTLRNGRLADLQAGRGFVYAEKLMHVGHDRLATMHRHELKVEDIIVRGDGRLTLEIWPDRDGRPDRAARARPLCDGVERELGPDGRLTLGPGESVTLTPQLWHAFWGEGGDVVVGEVSSVNDDETDNLFEEPVPRFPTIEEDAPATVQLVGERLA